MHQGEVVFEFRESCEWMVNWLPFQHEKVFVSDGYEPGCLRLKIGKKIRFIKLHFFKLPSSSVLHLTNNNFITEKDLII